MAPIGVLLIVEIWLVSATREAFLAGHHDVAISAAIASGSRFLPCLAPYLVYRPPG